MRFWPFFVPVLALPMLVEASPLQGEISRLEALNAAGEIEESHLVRLAEIYFLTSRCQDVKRLVKQHGPKAKQLALLGCACGSGCGERGESAELDRFRQLVEKGARWSNGQVQKQWSKVRHLPEAHYWALKGLRSDPGSYRDARLRAVRAELENELESLEVSPQTQ